MGEVTTKVAGLLPNIALLFNSVIYSDVQFVFMSDTGLTKKIYGHKLILALRSKGFATKFYGREESSSEVILPTSKYTSFSHLLRFLYTDDVQIHSFEEAHELYELANEYAVEELIDKCCNSMFQETTIENVFPKYECALRKNMQMLLKDCQDFVCSNTQLVLESIHFTDASEKVVEDIVKQNNLSVSSELEIIGAVLKWGSEELKRKKISPDEKYLRKCIDPFMKHLRFLTLSFSDFDYFIENFNIFSGYESSILTRKIYKSQCVVDFPESLCSITAKRSNKNGSKNMPKVTTESNSFFGSCPQISSHGLPSERASPVSVLSKMANDQPPKISHLISSSSTNASDKSILKPKVLNTPESPMISYEVRKYPNETSVSQSQLKQKNFRSTPNIDSILNPGNKHFQIPMNIRFREYELPLLESQPCLGTSFPKDVKSTIIFKMRTGNISLYGLELKVKNNNSRTREEFEIDVDFKGFSKQPYSHQFKKELKDNVLTLKFPKKMELREGCKGILDVSIDNLLLDRCNICDINDKGYRLNLGLGFACEISLSSNQKTGNSCIFLISKLIYVPH